MAQSDLDRSQPATPYKLQKARERGQVAKSPDVTSAVVFVSAMVFLTWQGWSVWREQFLLDRALLLSVGRTDFQLAAVWPLIYRALSTTLAMSIPFFVTLLVAAVVGNLVQTGPVLSLHPVKADWERLNPVAGLKRLFSLRTLFMALRAILKLGLLAVAAWMWVQAAVPHSYQLAALAPIGLMHALLDGLSSLGLRLAAILAAISLVDLIYSRREFAKNMRMSQREIKDEIKNREGDPRIRARLRELRREVFKRSLALRKTRDADVLITNPTHVAVALSYQHGRMHSPQLIAKGQGLMAAAMRRIAARHQIPVVQSPTLARALFRELPLDQHVPPAFYGQVARIIVWVLARKTATPATASGRHAVL